MADKQHALAPHELPGFLASADGSDKLMVFVIIFLLSLLLVIGNYYLKLHALPERMAHKTSHTQLQIITALALLALFTHNNLFWVAALLLAMVKFPDYLTPLNSIAKSLAEMRKQSKSETVIEDESQPTEMTLKGENSDAEEKQDA